MDRQSTYIQIHANVYSLRFMFSVFFKAVKALSLKKNILQIAQCSIGAPFTVSMMRKRKQCVNTKLYRFHLSNRLMQQSCLLLLLFLLYGLVVAVAIYHQY